MFDRIGGRTRARTWDPLIKSQLLYQLSYAPGMPPAKAPQGLGPVAKRVPTVQRRLAGTCLNLLGGVSKFPLPFVPAVRPWPGFPLEFTLAQAGAGMSGVCAPPVKTETLLRLFAPRGTFHNRTPEFHKRKAAGWGPGGSRTSAIVSGGWECDRRR